MAFKFQLEFLVFHKRHLGTGCYKLFGDYFCHLGKKRGLPENKKRSPLHSRRVKKKCSWEGSCCRLEKRGTRQVTPELCSAGETGGIGQEHSCLFFFKDSLTIWPIDKRLSALHRDSPCSGILFSSLGQC